MCRTIPFNLTFVSVLAILECTTYILECGTLYLHTRVWGRVWYTLFTRLLSALYILECAYPYSSMAPLQLKNILQRLKLYTPMLKLVLISHQNITNIKLNEDCLQFIGIYHSQFSSNENKLFLGQRLGEYVCQLEMGWNKHDLHILLLHMIPNEVMSHINVLGSCMLHRILGQAYCASVIAQYWDLLQVHSQISKLLL